MNLHRKLRSNLHRKLRSKPLDPLFPAAEDLGLDTDLYQLTMAAGYFIHGLNHRSSFELFARRQPAGWGYLLAAGLEQALHYLTELRFSGDAVDYLRSLPVFRQVPGDFF